MGSPAWCAVMLVVATMVSPALATNVAWGTGSVTIQGTSDPSMSLISMNASTTVQWPGGSTLLSRTAPSGLHVYAFHVADAPASVDANRLGNATRTFTVDVGDGFTTTEFEYDLDANGILLPDERTFRVNTGPVFMDADYGPTNAVLAVDVQRPASVWIDEVDIAQPSTTAAEMGFTDLGFEAGIGTGFGNWTAGNDLEPPHPVRDERTPYAGNADALLPISNEVSSGDRPWIQQTATGIPDKTLEKDVDTVVSFQARAPTNATCGAHLRTWDQAALKDDLEASVDVGSGWSEVQLSFSLSEKSDDIELTIFCTNVAAFTGAASSDFRLFMEPP